MANTCNVWLEDFEWAFGLNRSSLRWMGAWPEESSNQKFIDNWKMPLMVSTMFFFVFLPQMYALPLVMDNFPLVIDNLMTSIPVFISCLKLSIFWNNKEVLRPVVKFIIEDWRRPKSTWEYEVMKRAAFYGKMFTVCGYSLISISFTAFIIAPMYGLNIRLFSNVTDISKYPLVVQSSYPFDHTETPIFMLLYTSQALGSLMESLVLAVPDHYFGVLVFHLSGQFQILGGEVEHLVQKSNDKLIFKKKLQSCVNRHVYLIKMVSTVEKSFTLIIFAQVLSVCSMACCLGFRILYAFQNPSEGISIIQILTLLGGLFFLLLFTLSDCTASEVLAFYSSELFHKIYNSQWYVTPELSTRNLAIIMNMTKNPQRLTAGKIVYLSLLSYCSIVKSIAGYVSVLFAVNSR